MEKAVGRRDPWPLMPKLSPPFSLLWPLHYPTRHPLPNTNWLGRLEPLALVLTGSCLVSLLSPHSCGLNTEGWLKVEAEFKSPCHFSFNVCRGSKSVEQGWLIQGRKERGDRDVGRGSTEHSTQALETPAPGAAFFLELLYWRGKGERMASQFDQIPMRHEGNQLHV